jgi:MATE family multidrug resistance protein
MINTNNNEEHETNKLYLVKINNSQTMVSKYTGIVEELKEHLDDEEIKLCFSETVRKIIKVGLPMTLFFLSFYLEQSISLSFIGKKYNNPDMINAMGVVNLYIDCTYFSLVIGLLAGLDTLLSNSLGTSNFYLFGLYVHRARLITYLISAVLFVLHYLYGIAIISLFGIDAVTLGYCKEFFYPSLVYVLLIIQFSINYRILTLFEKTRVCVALILATLLLHPLWCYLFINVWGYGLKGASYSLILTQFINMIVSTVYMHFFNPNRETYFCINKDCFLGWKDYLKFTLPSTFIIFADAMAFEIQAIFAIFMTKEDYSLHIFISNIANIFFTLTHGFGIATTVIIAEKITKKFIKESKAIAIYSFILAEIIMSCIVILLILFRNSAITLFVDDETLINKGAPLVVLFALEEIFNITQGILACIYKGLGKQKEASIIAFVQFYVLQIIFTYIFGIKLKMGVIGIWTSILFGNMATTMLYLYYLNRFNFEKIGKETSERLEKDQELIAKNSINIVTINNN